MAKFVLDSVDKGLNEIDGRLSKDRFLIIGSIFRRSQVNLPSIFRLSGVNWFSGKIREKQILSYTK